MDSGRISSQRLLARLDAEVAHGKRADHLSPLEYMKDTHDSKYLQAEVLPDRSQAAPPGSLVPGQMFHDLTWPAFPDEREFGLSAQSMRMAQLRNVPGIRVTSPGESSFGTPCDAYNTGSFNIPAPISLFNSYANRRPKFHDETYGSTSASSIYTPASLRNPRLSLPSPVPGPSSYNSPDESEEETTASVSKRNHSDRRAEEPSRNSAGRMICKDPECHNLEFDRKCEWRKHMDKHDRPYRCQIKGCEKLQGFTYSGGLLRHEREAHNMHGGTKKSLYCPFPDCKLSSGAGFTRKENLAEHIRRVHQRTSTSADLGHLVIPKPHTDNDDVNAQPSPSADSEERVTQEEENFRAEIYRLRRLNDQEINTRRQLEDTVSTLQATVSELRASAEAYAQKSENRDEVYASRIQQLEAAVRSLRENALPSGGEKITSASTPHIPSGPSDDRDDSVSSSDSSGHDYEASGGSDGDSSPITTPRSSSSSRTFSTLHTSDNIRHSLQQFLLRCFGRAFNHLLYKRLHQSYTAALAGVRTCGNGSGSDGTQPSSNGRATSCNTTNSSGKRKRSASGNPPGEDDEYQSDQGQDEPPRKKGSPEEPGRPRRRLKCPFYQRRPEEHSRAACRGEGFADMAKLKDHLKRVHTKPVQCPRCWRTMKSNSEKDEHLQQDPICVRVPEPADDRISAQRLREMNLNAGPFGQAKTVEAKWRVLYRILFPAEEVVPSPYEISGMSLQFEKLFTKILVQELSKELGPALSRVEGRLSDIVGRCKELTDRASRASQVDSSPGNDQAHGSADSEPDTWEPNGDAMPEWSTEEWQGFFETSFQDMEDGNSRYGDDRSGLLGQYLHGSFPDFETPSI